MFKFNFPKTRFVPSESDVSRRAQADQITQEAAEVFSAAEKDDEQAYISELLDCIQACETALREFDIEVVQASHEEVIAKNTARGYYDKGGFKDCTSDDVNHPYYYTQDRLEAIEIIDVITTGLDGFDGYCLGNILKYALRAGKKGNARTDLEKANNYAHKMISGKWRWELSDGF